jgi:hypothetical protein
LINTHEISWKTVIKKNTHEISWKTFINAYAIWTIRPP